MRRRLLPVAVLTALALLIAACGAPAPAPGELRFYHNKNEWGPFYDELAAAGGTSTGLHLTATNIPQNENFVAMVKTSTMTRQKPDLFSWSVGADLEEIVAAGAAEDVTEIWDEAVANGDLEPGLRDVVTVDGRQYAIPQTSSYWVMYYRTDVFAELGIEPPTTWAEMEEAAETAQAAGITPFQQPGAVFAFVWFQILLGANDPALYEGLVDGSIPFTDPRVAEVMEQWKEMIDKGWMSDSLAATTNVNQLANRKVAMMPGGTFFAGDLAVEGLTTEDWGIFAIPARSPDIEKPVMFFEVGPVVASAERPNRDEIREYLRWWTTEEAQQVWADNLGDTSPNPKVELPDPEYTELARSLDDYQLLQRYYESVSPAVLTATLDGLSAFMINPGTYPRVLEQIEAVNAADWADRRAEGGR